MLILWFSDIEKKKWAKNKHQVWNKNMVEYEPNNGRLSSMCMCTVWTIECKIESEREKKGWKIECKWMYLVESPSWRLKIPLNKTNWTFIGNAILLEINSFFCAWCGISSFNKDFVPICRKTCEQLNVSVCLAFVCMCAVLCVSTSFLNILRVLLLNKNVCCHKMHLSIDATYNKCLNPATGYRKSKMARFERVLLCNRCVLLGKREIIKW